MNVQIESGLPAMVTGKQPPWLYLRPRAFPSYFLPVHSEGGGMRVQLGEGLAAMQGQPTAVRSAILLPMVIDHWCSEQNPCERRRVRERTLLLSPPDDLRTYREDVPRWTEGDEHLLNSQELPVAIFDRLLPAPRPSF